MELGASRDSGLSLQDIRNLCGFLVDSDECTWLKFLSNSKEAKNQQGQKLDQFYKQNQHPLLFYIPRNSTPHSGKQSQLTWSAVNRP